MSSIFTFYLVATAWATVRRGEGRTGLFDKVALCVAIGCAAALALSGARAASSPTGQFQGYSIGPYLMNALVAMLAAGFDIKVIRHGGISGAPRIERHLWRMCLAFFYSAASALTQLQKLLPGHVAGLRVLYVLLALAVMPLVMLIFWMSRVRFTRWYGGAASKISAVQA